jgi:hypothetical protein
MSVVLSFSSGTGLGSSKSGSAGTFMKTFAGAAAGTVSGLLLFEAGLP